MCQAEAHVASVEAPEGHAAESPEAHVAFVEAPGVPKARPGWTLMVFLRFDYLACVPVSCRQMSQNNTLSLLHRPQPHRQLVPSSRVAIFNCCL